MRRGKKIRRSEEKNEKLKQERGICFEQIQSILVSDLPHIWDDHPKRQNQQILLVILDNYVHVIPFVENEHEIRLKTIHPSRVHHSLFYETLLGKKRI